MNDTHTHTHTHTHTQQREGEEAAHLVVGLVRLRNVARSVKPFLRALSAFTHNIVVLDDASVDGTSDLIQVVDG